MAVDVPIHCPYSTCTNTQALNKFLPLLLKVMLLLWGCSCFGWHVLLEPSAALSLVIVSKPAKECVAQNWCLQLWFQNNLVFCAGITAVPVPFRCQIIWKDNVCKFLECFCWHVTTILVVFSFSSLHLVKVLLAAAGVHTDMNYKENLFFFLFFFLSICYNFWEAAWLSVNLSLFFMLSILCWRNYLWPTFSQITLYCAAPD